MHVQRLKKWGSFLIFFLLFVAPVFSYFYNFTNGFTTIPLRYSTKNMLLEVVIGNSSCKGCAFGEKCKFYINQALDYHNEEKISNFRYVQFEELVKGLPKFFIPKESSPFHNDETVGKMLRSWINLIVESSFFSKSKLNADITSDLLNDYKWLPLSKEFTFATALNMLNLSKDNLELCESKPFAWLMNQKNTVSRPIKYLVKPEYTAEDSMFLWFYSTRFIIQNHIGVCLEALVKKMIEKKHSLPKSFTNSEQSFFTISMHIRRGDSCERYSEAIGDSNMRIGRPCFLTKLYFSKAFEICNKLSLNRPCVIKLVTDSSQTIKEASHLSQFYNFSLEYLDFNRDVFAVKNTSRQEFIEVKKTTNEERLLIFITFFSELIFAGTANAFVGTSLSWVSRLLFFQIGGSLERIPAFSFLDAPLVSRSHGSLIWWESHLEDRCSVCSCKVP